jgi:coenzyme F420-0:L-glutamate ligase/coenzyme F420-1:gamma-L-glutamate ligase
VQARRLTITAVGDDLCAFVARVLRRSDIIPSGWRHSVVAQKIVSKAEGPYSNLADVQLSASAYEIAARVRRDPRLVEVILSESAEILRMRERALIPLHRLGFVLPPGRLTVVVNTGDDFELFGLSISWKS